MSVDEQAVSRVERESWVGFKTEQRGIDHVPHSDRYTSPRHLFWMWAGSTLNVLVFVYGSLVVLTGLSFLQSVVVIVAGSVAGYAVLGLVSLAGPTAGTSQLTISRAPFGLNWNRFNALCNWLLVVGYEILDLSIIVLAAVALFAKAGINDSTGLKVGLILAAVAIQLPLPLLGHATVLKVMKPLAVLLGVFFIVMAVLLAGKMHPGHLHQHAGVGGISVALALTLSGGGLGWAAYGSDYSRYVPSSTPRPRTFWAVTLGSMIPQILVMTLGAAVTTTVSGASNEISGLPKALPGWFVVPYLLLAIISLFAVNTVDLYSSGLNLLATGIKIKRWQAVCVDMTICTALLFPVIFSDRFNTLVSDFLLFGLVWISPWVAIVVTDWFLRRGRYDHVSLFSVGRGIYWRHNGIHWPAAIAQVVGMVCSALWLNAYPSYVSPISRALSDSDFDIFFGGVAAAVIYFVLARRSVRQEVLEPSEEMAVVLVDTPPSPALERTAETEAPLL